MQARLRRALPSLAVCLALLSLACEAGPKASNEVWGPPEPTPVGVAIGQLTDQPVGMDGGTASVGGVLTVTVPPGAVSAPVDITVQEITNLAPHAVGGAYRLGPEGTQFSKPVSITFSAGVSDHDIDDLAIAYQDSSGYWVRPWPVVRDRAAGTLTVTTTHFSDWTLVTTPSGRDLTGSFQLTQTVALPFLATGSATLSYAGENASETFFMVPGSVTASVPVPYGSTTCTTATPTMALPVQLGEMIKATSTSPAELLWGINAYWPLTCANGATNIITTQFDTAGINLIGCSRHYNGTQINGPARAQGSYTIDCGTKGTATATWDFQSAICGTACTSTNPCHAAAWSCATGVAICIDTGDVSNGTSCGTNMVCYQGTCVACTAGVTCTPSNMCDTGLTSCSTGQEVCVDQGPNTAVNGTTCGTNAVCYNGTCNPCTAGVTCTPSNMCDAGLTSCSTGQELCVDQGPNAAVNGTTCGTNAVCNNGTCNACTVGVVCTPPSNICDTGLTSCSTGQEVCVDQGPNTAVNGTTCGTNAVCYNGTCNGCTAGVPCTPTNVCDTGLTSCSSGQQVCVDQGPNAAVNGTTCGLNAVCYNGTCNTCTAGAPCTGNPNPCDSGVTSCSTGTPVCVNGTQLANGTSCGTNGVCYNGTCNACTAGAPCTGNPNPCYSGVTSCSTGAPVCVNGTQLGNGTSCGSNLVCYNGTCNTCTANVACTPTNLCDSGLTSCSTGQQTCTDTGPNTSLNGTSCGTNQVCYNGTCNTCTANVACTPTNVCDSGVTSCSTGQQICTDTGPNASVNGTSCGTNQVCYNGTCTNCTANVACTPTNVCDSGLTSCSTGQSVCVDQGPNPSANGTTCGTGQTCNAGACVLSGPVSGTRMVTYWPDSGLNTSGLPGDLATAGVFAAVPDGRGGLVTYLGTFNADGSYSIPNVPAGPYLLVVKDGTGFIRAVQTSATTVDLGWNVVGRQDAAYPTAATPVTLDLSAGGLAPWTLGDEIQIASSNANLWDIFATGASTPPSSLLDDWSASQIGGPMYLLSSGDVLYIYQLHSATDSLTGGSYLAATQVAWESTATLTSGAASSIVAFPALTTATPGTLTVDWNLGAFETYLASMNPNAALASAQHTLMVGATPQQLAYGTSGAPSMDRAGTPTLFRMQSTGGSAPFIKFTSPATYGHALDTSIWQEWRGVEFDAYVPYQLTGTTPIGLAASIGERDPIATATIPIAPTLSPPTSPRLNGADAFGAASGVGTIPTFSWSAPALGTPTSYTVEIFSLQASGGATTATFIASVTTGGLQVQVPPGVLSSGGTYCARITAFAKSPDSFATAPERSANVYVWASLLTASFTP